MPCLLTLRRVPLPPDAGCGALKPVPGAFLPKHSNQLSSELRLQQGNNLSRLLAWHCAERVRAREVFFAMERVAVGSSPRHKRFDVYAGFSSSSPGIPPLSELLPKNPKKPPLRSGSKAAPIPKDAVATFTTAASVWRSAQLEPAASDSPVRPSKQYAANPAPQWRRAPTTVIEVASDTSSPLLPDAPHQEASAITGKPWRKFKSRGSNQNHENPMETRPSNKSASAQEDTTVSRHFAGEAKGESSLKDTECLGGDAPLGLEPALPRRREWTPPPNDTVSPRSDSSAADPSGLRLGDPSKAPGIFNTLHETYALRDGEAAFATPEAAPTTGGSRKRKTNVTAPINGAKISPVKAKAPKKKPRTITELAMAAYLPPPNPAAATDRNLPNPIPGPGPPSDDMVMTLTSVHPAAQLRKGRKMVADKGKKKKTGPRRRNVLLSPVSAMQQSTRQDFLFGTSSQLVTENSPAFMRELQIALKTSNQPEEDPFIGFPGNEGDRLAPKGRLWLAGARGSEGDLVAVEVIDLVDSPDFPRDPMVDALTRQVEVSPIARRVAALPTYPNNTEPKSPGPSTAGLGQRVDGNPCERFVSTAVADAEEDFPPSPPSNQEASQQGRANKITVARELQRPKFELFTDSQLAKEITSYGFKTIKRRTAMISLLNDCWESKQRLPSVVNLQRAAVSSMAAAAPSRSAQPDNLPSHVMVPVKRPRGRPKNNAPAPSHVSIAQKRPRGRPRKGSGPVTGSTAAAGSVAMNYEVSDVAPVPAATPKRKGKAQKPRTELIIDSDSEALSSSPSAYLSSPPAADLSVDEETEMSLMMSPTSQQSSLFGHITKAVTGSPRSTDPSNPSWHEKMLLYDPIVLEDLAAWLNSGELDRVGYDGEVSPVDVKKWCESKSICCLWRVNLHGKERKRF